MRRGGDQEDDEDGRGIRLYHRAVFVKYNDPLITNKPTCYEYYHKALSIICTSTSISNTSSNKNNDFLCISLLNY